ncbi:MAG: hypothetical protein ABJL99_13850 [Aliishimia sp.]
MMAATILALLGMGVLASSILPGSDDDASDLETTETSEGSEDISQGLVHQLNAFDAVSGTPDGDIFAAEHVRGETDVISLIDDFDPTQDVVAFDLDDLSRNCVDQDGNPHFDQDAALHYDLSTETEPETGSTRITLTLFDDFGTDPVHYDVLLNGVPEITDENISVVVGQSDLAQANGGERADIQTGSDGDDQVTISTDTDITQTGAGDDLVTGTGSETLILTGAGNDSLSVEGNDIHVYGGSGDDDLAVLSQPESGQGINSDVSGGDGNDSITIGLGTDADGGNGSDTITLNVTSAPTDGQPLFLWKQPVEDDRFSAHSVITLDDASDTINLNIDPSVAGHLHQVTLIQESFGTNSQEVFTKEYTLILWSPEAVTDIVDLVSGTSSIFNGTLAQDSAIGEAAYETAANDLGAPRVILTIENGSSYSGDFDENAGTSTDGYDKIYQPDLVFNREITSLHSAEIW